jgi:hypothetical protein
MAFSPVSQAQARLGRWRADHASQLNDLRRGAFRFRRNRLSVIGLAIVIVMLIIAATAVGACNVEAADSLSGIRPWQATLDRVAAGWPRRELLLDAPGWEFDETHQLWLGPA